MTNASPVFSNDTVIFFLGSYALPCSTALTAASRTAMAIRWQSSSSKGILAANASAVCSALFTLSSVESSVYETRSKVMNSFSEPTTSHLRTLSCVGLACSSEIGSLPVACDSVNRLLCRCRSALEMSPISLALWPLPTGESCAFQRYFRCLKFKIGSGLHFLRYSAIVNHGLALSRLLGTRVTDSSGVVAGKVREVALRPQEDPTRVSGLVIKTASGDRFLVPSMIQISVNAEVRASSPVSEWPQATTLDDFFLLERDLLDQQIIDVHGRKVVRVNDVDLYPESVNGGVNLKISEVDVGLRGAVRRLLKGVAPAAATEAVVRRLKPRVIPWEFVDLIETNPARRVKLRIAHERLSQLHPADIADIVEELAPAEREAVFETLDEGVAAEALEEVDLDIQASILESLDPERAADIVEEMDPDAAADLLDQLPEDRSEEILEEMEPAEREEVSELLEHGEKTAAGRM